MIQAACAKQVICWLSCLIMLALSNTVAAADAADTALGLMCDSIYCREQVDQDWQVRITGQVVSLAGIYVLVQDVEGRVIFQGKVPAGQYPQDRPYVIRIPRDGVMGHYLVTVLGSQVDYQHIRLPYTDLPGEVYGGKTFAVTTHGPRKPWEVIAPGQLFFQVSADRPQVTLTQGERPWTIHQVDGEVVFDVQQQGRIELHRSNRRKQWVGTFTGTPGKTYVIGHTLQWFLVQPAMYLSLTADRWFEPDPRFLTLKWWMKTP